MENKKIVNKKISTIQDAEEVLSSELQDALRKVAIPSGFRAVVSLRHNSERYRKVRYDAEFKPNFIDRIDERAILITFEPEEAAASRGAAEAPAQPRDIGFSGENIDALIRALSRAQSRPTGFVGLKWFRDIGMANDPALASVDRGELLRVAIERGIVKTGKVPNPKNPDYPVTSIWLENSALEVQRVIAAQRGRPAFNPVTVRGEALSTTVARERR
jgi:hypothetical protein